MNSLRYVTKTHQGIFQQLTKDDAVVTNRATCAEKESVMQTSILDTPTKRRPYRNRPHWKQLHREAQAEIKQLKVALRESATPSLASGWTCPRCQSVWVNTLVSTSQSVLHNSEDPPHAVTLTAALLSAIQECRNTDARATLRGQYVNDVV